MAIKYGELNEQFKLKIKFHFNVKDEKYSEDEPTEVINHHIPNELFDNLTENN